MITPIIIDISETANAFLLSKEDINSLSRYVLDRIGVSYMREWEHLVNENLHKTREMYKRGMSVEKIDDFNIAFVLTGKEESRVALMIERGASAFDIKSGFERSDKRTIKDNGGWFLTIPFRLATSEALAESSAFSGNLPEPIQELARSQSGIPITKIQIPEELRVKGIRKEMISDGSVIPEYHHKTGMWEGVVHKKNVENKGGTYMKFRRVSDNSDEFSWFHPGFTAYNLMDKALEEIKIDFIYDKARDEFLSKIL